VSSKRGYLARGDSGSLLTTRQPQPRPAAHLRWKPLLASYRALSNLAVGIGAFARRSSTSRFCFDQAFLIASNWSLFRSFLSVTVSSRIISPNSQGWPYFLCRATLLNLTRDRWRVRLAACWWQSQEFFSSIAASLILGWISVVVEKCLTMHRETTLCGFRLVPTSRIPVFGSSENAWRRLGLIRLHVVQRSGSSQIQKASRSSQL